MKLCEHIAPIYQKCKFCLYPAFIFFLILMLLFSCGCSCISGTSPALYDTDFYEKYYIDDPNLFYTTANTWEKTSYKISDDIAGGWGELNYATIPDTDPEHFLVVRRSEYSILGGAKFYSFYQGHEAPIPTKDWTIADVQIIKGKLRSGPNDKITYREFYQTLIDNGTPFFIWSEQGCPTNLIEEIQASWKSQLIDLKDKKCKETVYKDSFYDENRSPDNYILCVHFNENPHIVWMATLYEGTDGYYLGCENEVWDFQETTKVYPMGENWNQVLEEALHDTE